MAETPLSSHLPPGRFTGKDSPLHFFCGLQGSTLWRHTPILFNFDGGIVASCHIFLVGKPIANTLANKASGTHPVRHFPEVPAPLELIDIPGQVLPRYRMGRAAQTTLQERPETLDGIRGDIATSILASTVVHRLVGLEELSIRPIASSLVLIKDGRRLYPHPQCFAKGLVCNARLDLFTSTRTRRCRRHDVGFVVFFIQLQRIA